MLEKIATEVDRLLTSTEVARREVSFNLARCARLRQSTLKWAFEGRLVDQDPSDEPASELLERIKAERGAVGGSKKRRSRVP